MIRRYHVNVVSSRISYSPDVPTLAYSIPVFMYTGALAPISSVPHGDSLLIRT